MMIDFTACPVNKFKGYGGVNGNKINILYNDVSYMLLSWVEGQDLEEVLPNLSIEKQYHLGRRAGEILRKIHGISVSENDMPSETKKLQKQGIRAIDRVWSTCCYDYRYKKIVTRLPKQT